MSKELKIKAAAKAVQDKHDEIKKLDAELSDLKIAHRYEVVRSDEAPAPAPVSEE